MHVFSSRLFSQACAFCPRSAMSGVGRIAACAFIPDYSSIVHPRHQLGTGPTRLATPAGSQTPWACLNLNFGWHQSSLMHEPSKQGSRDCQVSCCAESTSRRPAPHLARSRPAGSVRLLGAWCLLVPRLHCFLTPATARNASCVILFASQGRTVKTCRVSPADRNARRHVEPEGCARAARALPAQVLQ